MGDQFFGVSGHNSKRSRPGAWAAVVVAGVAAVALNAGTAQEAKAGVIDPDPIVQANNAQTDAFSILEANYTPVGAIATADPTNNPITGLTVHDGNVYWTNKLGGISYMAEGGSGAEGVIGSSPDTKGLTVVGAGYFPGINDLTFAMTHPASSNIFTYLLDGTFAGAFDVDTADNLTGIAYDIKNNELWLATDGGSGVYDKGDGSLGNSAPPASHIAIFALQDGFDAESLLMTNQTFYKLPGAVDN
jgi:hypothetical protein